MESIPRVILLIDLSRAYGRSLLSGIAEYARLKGPWEFCLEPEFYPLLLRKRKLGSLGADGIIMRNPGGIEKIRELGVPIIVATKKRIQGVSTINTDGDNIGKMAAKHLLDRGFKSFAFFGLEDIDWSEERGKSFAKCVAEIGFKTFFYNVKASFYKNEQRYSPSKPWLGEHLKLADWLSSLPKPLGLMACNDDGGRDIIEACKVAQLSVPESVAVIGADNDPIICQLCNPPLTSIALSTEKAGYEAAELLDKLMHGKKYDDKEIIVSPQRVVTRQSTDVLAIEDEVVAEAIRFIRQNRRRLLQVRDVAENVAMNYRSLQRRFQAGLNRTINAEITRVRIEEITRLLLETDWTIYQIATHMGYDGADHIGRYFKRVKGISCNDFRRQHGKVFTE